MTETQFGIQFIVTRNGEPISDVVTIENMPITLHEEHARPIVWTHQVHTLVELTRAELFTIDALSDVIPETHRVGLEPAKSHPVLETFGTPILKVVNRALIAMNKRLMAYNAKRGDDVG